jgi:hypothetical protein
MITKTTFLLIPNSFNNYITCSNRSCCHSSAKSNLNDKLELQKSLYFHIRFQKFGQNELLSTNCVASYFAISFFDI